MRQVDSQTIVAGFSVLHEGKLVACGVKVYSF